jgi:hypothetical protein
MRALVGSAIFIESEMALLFRVHAVVCSKST